MSDVGHHVLWLTLIILGLVIVISGLIVLRHRIEQVKKRFEDK